MTSQCPIFIEHDPETGATLINGDVYRSFQAATTHFRRKADMNVYLQLMQYHEVHFNEETPQPLLDNTLWEIEDYLRVGMENMVRLKARESINFNLFDTKIDIPKGYVSGWILHTAANMKAIRDRNLFVCENSIIFGDIIGKVLLQNSIVIGTIRDTHAQGSRAYFIEASRSTIAASDICYSRLTNARVLHSYAADTVLFKALVSSSRLESTTLVRSQVTDGNLNIAGLIDSNASSVTISQSKVVDFSQVGGTPVVNSVKAPVIDVLINSLMKVSLEKERGAAVSELKGFMGWKANEATLVSGEPGIVVHKGNIEAVGHV